MMQNYDEIILKTQVQLKRNFEDYYFTNKLSLDEAEEIAKGVYRIFENEFEFKKLKNIKEQVRLKMLECDEITPDLLDNLDISYIATKNNISLMINGEEHLSINCIGNNLNFCYNLAQEIDDRISSLIPFSYDKNIGYLTSNYKYFGNGILIKIVLFLPALFRSNKIQALSKTLLDKNIILTHKYDNTIPIFELYNNSCNSISDIELINFLNSEVEKICEQELKEQNILKEICKNDIKDEVYRAVGNLKYCYCISKEEAIKLLCLLKLGKLQNYIFDFNSIPHQDKTNNILTDSQEMLKRLKYCVQCFNLLNIIYNIQDSSLQEFFSNLLNKKDIDIKRAEYLNNYFSYNN